MKRRRLLRAGAAALLGAAVLSTAALAEAMTADESAGMESVQSSNLDTPWTDGAYVMRGRYGSMSRRVHLPRDGRGKLKLRLKWSEIIDEKSSVLTTEVDGVPIQTARLSKRSNRTMNVDLGELSAGFHIVTLRVHLVGDEDRCLEHHIDDTWLRLEDSSRLRIKLFGVAVDSLEDLPMRWSQRETPAQIEVDGWSPAKAAAALELSHTLARWGVHSGARSASFGVRLEQRAGDVATVELSNDRLVIAAAEPAHWMRALKLIERPSFRARCAVVERCLVDPVLPQKETIAEDKDPEPEDPASVLRLETIGYQQGWTATGEGTHRLKMVWTPPALWKLRETPRFRLNVLRSGASIAAGSTLTVKWMDTPIATYEVDELASDAPIELDIPLWAWERVGTNAPWVFDITAALVGPDEQRCRPVPPESGPWITLGPDSGLFVPRVEPEASGIAGFWSDNDGNRPLLVWGNLPDLADALAIAPQLAPWANRSPNETWRFVDAVPQEAWIHPIVGGDAPELEHAFLRTVNDTRYWSDPTGGLGPLVPVEHSAGLHLRPETDGAAEGLTLWLGNDQTEDAAGVAPYGALEGREALADRKRQGSWTSLGPRDDTALTVIDHEAPLPPQAGGPTAVRPLSQEQVGQLAASWLWALIAVVMTLGSWFWIRRNAKFVPGSELEKKNAKEGEG